MPPEIEDLIERARLHADFMQYLALLIGERPVSGVPAERGHPRKLEQVQKSLAERGAFTPEFLASIGAQNLGLLLGRDNQLATL